MWLKVSNFFYGYNFRVNLKTRHCNSVLRYLLASEPALFFVYFPDFIDQCSLCYRFRIERKVLHVFFNFCFFRNRFCFTTYELFSGGNRSIPANSFHHHLILAVSSLFKKNGKLHNHSSYIYVRDDCAKKEPWIDACPFASTQPSQTGTFKLDDGWKWNNGTWDKHVHFVQLYSKQMYLWHIIFYLRICVYLPLHSPRAVFLSILYLWMFTCVLLWSSLELKFLSFFILNLISY